MRNVYPYTDAHELNLDWILKQIKKLGAEWEDFKVINQIVYKGVWDPTKTYDAYNIVDYENVAYISTRIVPAGTHLDNTDYWVIIADYSQLFEGGNYLNNKKVVVYGDSTIARLGGLSYMDIVETTCNCKVTNRAVAGSAMNRGANNGVSLITASDDLTDYDFIFLAYGTNEWQMGLSRDDIRNDLLSLLSAVYSKNAKIEVIFVNPYYSYHVYGTNPANYNTKGMTIEVVNGIIQNELDIRNIPYIDFYHRSGCSEQNYTALLEDSGGGIYVHANNSFKKELAAIVAKGGNCRNFDKHIEEMLFSYDFLVGQKNVTTAQFSGSFGSGLALYLGAGTTISSTQKVVDNNQWSEYIIKGKTDAALTITFAGRSVDVTPGQFKIRLIGLNTQYSALTITNPDANAYISELQMYHISNCPEGNTEVTKFGRPIVLTPDATNVVTISDYPTFSFAKEGIKINAGQFTITNNLSGTSLLFTAGSADFGHAYGIIFNASSGNVYPVEYIDNMIRTYYNIPSGTYILVDKIISPAYNPNVEL